MWFPVTLVIKMKNHSLQALGAGQDAQQVRWIPCVFDLQYFHYAMGFLGCLFVVDGEVHAPGR